MRRPGWDWWGDQAESYEANRPLIPTYNGHAVLGDRNRAVPSKG